MAPAPSAPPDPRLTILGDLLKSFEEEYKEYTRIGAIVDDKAQKTATTAGAFLAAALAFVKQADLRAMREMAGPWAILLLMFAVVALILCICFCVIALRVRSIPFRLPAGLLRQWAYNICDLYPYEITPAMRTNYLKMQIDGWNNTINEMKVTLKDKSDGVKAAQGILVGSVACVALLLITLLGENLFR